MDCFTHKSLKSASGLLQIGHNLGKWQWCHNLLTSRHRQFFDVLLCHLSSLVTGLSFMSKSSLVLKLWQFSFRRNWPKIRKSEILLSEFCLISRDWRELGIPNLARMSQMKCYWMLQNARVTAIAFSELFREN